MKKVIIVPMFLLVNFVFAQESTINFNQLPKNSQMFVKKHFSKATVSSVIKDKEPTGTDYKVIMTDGTKITFDGRGDWDDVETMGYAVPEAIVPASIRTYVIQNFKGIDIVGIDKGSRKYKVELANGIDLEFNRQGKFIKIDD